MSNQTNIYTLQKSNATQLWSIRHVRYHVKVCLFVFPLSIICSNSFIETCAGWEILGQCQKLNVAKLHHKFNRSYQLVYGLTLIMLCIIWTPIYLSFHWYLIWFDCFTETCTGWEKWGQCQKYTVAKLHQYLNSTWSFCFGSFRY